MSDDSTEYDTFNSISKAEAFIDESDNDALFESIYSIIILNKQKSLGKVSVGLLIQLPITLIILYNKYKPLAGTVISN